MKKNNALLERLMVWYFKWRGWKTGAPVPPELKKCVMIVAPHTSGWDFIYGAAAKSLLGFDAKYLAKKELFRWPLKRMFIQLGGVPVDRGKHNGMVEAMIDYLNKNERAIVVFPPEGTRKRTTRWKKGFYHVAMGANVPIIMAYIDFKQKKAGMGPYFMPSGDIQQDFKRIAGFYKDITACHPEKFALPE